MYRLHSQTPHLIGASCGVSRLTCRMRQRISQFASHLREKNITGFAKLNNTEDGPGSPAITAPFRQPHWDYCRPQALLNPPPGRSINLGGAIACEDSVQPRRCKSNSKGRGQLQIRLKTSGVPPGRYRRVPCAAEFVRAYNSSMERCF